MHPDSMPVQALVARRLRAFRNTYGLTRDQVAQRARTYGMTWDASSIGRFETERAAVTLPALVVLAGVLAELTNMPITLDALTEGAHVELTPDLVVDEAAFRDFLRGRPVSFTPECVRGSGETVGEIVDQVLRTTSGGPPNVTTDENRTIRTWNRAPSLAEQRAAQRLGIGEHALAQWSLRLWGKSFDDEVTSRAGNGASPQRRGHATRQATDEIRAARGKAVDARGDD